MGLIGRGHFIRGYLNATPRQGTETLANWPSFRIEHVGDEEHTKDVRLIASAHGLTVSAEFRDGYPVTVNDEAETRFAAGVVAGLLGEEPVQGVRCQDLERIAVGAAGRKQG